MQELDRPATEACGDSPMPMSMPMSMPPMPDKPDTPPPSMSLNLNAQGMDNIEELMKLMTKVNPDMINQPAPMSSQHRTYGQTHGRITSIKDAARHGFRAT